MAYTETVTEFFDRLALPPSVDTKGIVEFQIEGEGTYRFDLAEGRVVKKKDGITPELIVRARSFDFLALVEGRMSVEDGLLTERLHLAGDMLQISRLIGALKLTQPPAS